MEYTYKPTTNGRAVMAACMALEKPFHITRVAFGSGRVDEDANLADQHDLIQYAAEANCWSMFRMEPWQTAATKITVSASPSSMPTASART